MTIKPLNDELIKWGIDKSRSDMNTKKKETNAIFGFSMSF
jgi:hypothetical protein